MIERHGYFFPDDDRDAHGVIMRDCGPDIERLMPFVKGRECVIQAGGNVGVYAIALAKLFGSVVTVEPDASNFACLEQNVKAFGVTNIDYTQAALGQEPGVCRIDVVHPGNCGAHRISLGGEIPVVTIDALDAAPDLIWLDIEGFELPALKGAERTIDKHGPLIVCEEKGLGDHYGVRSGAIEAWLEPFGYQKLTRIGRDNVYGRT